MLKLCACKEQLFHPPLYLSHAQKVLAQTVMVPRPYLRFPWRFLHPQVGNPHASSTCPRMCHSFSHHTHITCWFGVCHHVFWGVFCTYFTLRGLKLHLSCVGMIVQHTTCSRKFIRLAVRSPPHLLCTYSHACTSVPAFALTLGADTNSCCGCLCICATV